MITLKYGVHEHVVVPTVFPDGTSQVWHLPDEAMAADRVIIDWRFSAEREIIDIANLGVLFGKRADLYMPYLPYGRQDKMIGNDAAFALRAFARMINAAALGFVSACDVHNWVAFMECFGSYRSNNRDVHDLHVAVADRFAPHCIVLPDAGARQRYKEIERIAPVVVFDKTREPSTGEIMTMGPALPSWNTNLKRYLIIDDICDGGQTFRNIASIVRTIVRDATIGLFVTHGVFSKGRTIEGIDKVYTTNSLPQNADSEFKV